MSQKTIPKPPLYIEVDGTIKKIKKKDLEDDYLGTMQKIVEGDIEYVYHMNIDIPFWKVLDIPNYGEDYNIIVNGMGAYELKENSFTQEHCVIGTQRARLFGNVAIVPKSYDSY